MHCIITSIMFGGVYYLSVLRVYSKYTLFKESNEQLKMELKVDKLTGLFNRGTFDADLKKILDS
ncbi:hypothetical protein LGK95_10860 [Clostridium algoriphilum]|uniref:hypothetical protein n=1 Tax=Clostridium algoriphilum TaxID=198347 RepID=UPI001CF357B6|nr:hypothetical protein [Clostridium algoriphilum]MCB2294019.1 hypothetical protein [Clostridium algoriphilum]